VVDARRSAAFLFVAHAALFLGCIVWANLDPGAASIIEPHRGKWVTAAAFDAFFAWYVPAVALSLAVAAASSAVSEKGARSNMSGAFLPGFAFVALASALYLLAMPGFEAERAVAERQSARYSAALASTRDAVEARDWKAAQGFLTRARAAWDGGPEIAELRALVTEGLSKTGAEGAAKAETPPTAVDEAGGAREALAQAVKAVEERRWFDAHYYASLAFKLDPKLVNAQRIAAIAWTEISSSEIGEGEIEASRLYAKKKDGYAKLDSGDALGAYSIFLGLSKEAGDDPDVGNYLERSRKALSRTGFFLDEIEAAKNAPMTPGYALATRKTGDDGTALLWIACASVARTTADSVYFESFALSAFDERGKKRFEARSPYAKLRDEGLVLRAVDRNDPSRTWEANVVPAPTDPIEAFLLDPPPFSLAEASGRAVAELTPRSLPLFDLLTAASATAALGGDAVTLTEEACRRVAFPLGALAAIALSAAAGIRLRFRGGAMPKGYYALVPVIALAIFPALDSASWAWRVFLSIFARLVGSPGDAVTVTLIALSIALAISLFLLATSKAPAAARDNAEE
jgi:hypothetical protein